ncbi:MAG: hypothetical protein VR68_09615 [Peptococcaceae bacterium BRH_c4a]|nr:MAG: hypothetical protein VR68_09615 [Peptococcaceae bacterium BRH_c4a]
MTADKKNKQNTRPDKRAFNYWIWLILIGPAFFFLYYWLTSNPVESRKQKPFLPEKQLQAGEPASVNGITLMAAPGGRVSYTETLSLANNKVMAEGGSQFLVIPLVIPEKSGDPAPDQWYITDSGGNRYDLLKVTLVDPTGGQTARPIQGNRLVHMIFKIKKGNQQNFLVYKPGKDHAAWQVPPQS